MKLYFTNHKNRTSKTVFDYIITDYLGFLLRDKINRKVEEFRNNKKGKSSFFASIFQSDRDVSHDDFKKQIC